MIFIKVHIDLRVSLVGKLWVIFIRVIDLLVIYVVETELTKRRKKDKENTHKGHVQYKPETL